jgi:two-component system, response regulator PdtaR
LKALICEDEGITNILLQRGLQAAGYEVIGKAMEGRTGVELARELQPDFIVMDIDMPGMNGIEATRLIMQERPIPIIILSAYSDDDYVNAAIDAGACAYLVKPCISAQLTVAIKTSLARFAMLQQIEMENDDLKAQLEVRKLTEQATKLLVTRLQVTEEEAFKKIQQLSHERGESVYTTAQGIIQFSDLLNGMG